MNGMSRAVVGAANFVTLKERGRGREKTAAAYDSCLSIQRQEIRFIHEVRSVQYMR